MSLKQRLTQQLHSARQTTTRLLADFTEDQHWVYQVHPGGNHALWIMGHLGHADNFFTSLVVPTAAHSPEGWDDAFGTGSHPTGLLTDYPPLEDVRSYFRDRRANLLAVLEAIDESELDQPTPDGTPDFLADFGMVFQAAAWHEGLHSGQISVVRRALGHEPVT